MGSALLWHQLMGDGVLAVGNDTAPHLRTYAHCSKGRVSLNIQFLVNHLGGNDVGKQSLKYVYYLIFRIARWTITM